MRMLCYAVPNCDIFIFLTCTSLKSPNVGYIFTSNKVGAFGFTQMYICVLESPRAMTV